MGFNLLYSRRHLVCEHKALISPSVAARKQGLFPAALDLNEEAASSAVLILARSYGRSEYSAGRFA